MLRLQGARHPRSQAAARARTGAAGAVHAAALRRRRRARHRVADRRRPDFAAALGGGGDDRGARSAASRPGAGDRRRQRLRHRAARAARRRGAFARAAPDARARGGGRLSAFGLDNVRVEWADGLAYDPGPARFDAILVHAVVEPPPTRLLAHLAEGGALVAVVAAKTRPISASSAGRGAGGERSRPASAAPCGPSGRWRRGWRAAIEPAVKRR